MSHPTDRWRGLEKVLHAVAIPERMAILEYLAARGPMALGLATHEMGIGCNWARHHARVLESAGLIAVDRDRGGLNLSATCTITPAGRAFVESMSELLSIKEAIRV